MNLHSVSTRFDKTVCTDAYNPTTMFLGQLDIFDDSKRDGVTVDRRILSCSPDVVIPARRTILIDGKAWLIGQNNPDSFRGRPIRSRYILHACEYLGILQTAKELLSSGGLPLYAATVWIKDSKEMETSSKLYSFFNAYFAKGEPVEAGMFLTLGSVSYRIRNVFESAAGVTVGEASVLPNGSFQTALYKGTAGQTYDAINDNYTTSADVTIDGIYERFGDSYEYESQAAEKYQIGDRLFTIEVSSVANPKVGDNLTLLGGPWRVVSVQASGNCWELQVRRA